MRRVTWMLRRCKAMKPAEIAWRIKARLRMQVERRQILAGWQPIPPVSVAPNGTLFPAELAWQETWCQHFSLNTSKLNEMAHGKVQLFGNLHVDMGERINWHRDPFTGITAPQHFGKALNYRDERQVGNIKVLWELARQQHLIPLAVAYALSGEVRWRNAVIDQINGWIKANPYGLGVHWCSSLEVSLRLISWTVIHGLFALRDGKQGLFAGHIAGLGQSIWQHLHFIKGHLSLHSSANNHLIGELTGLFVATCAFNIGEAGQQLHAFARQLLIREAERQVHQDGVDREQAFYYHLWVLEYLLVASLIGQRFGSALPSTIDIRIQQMAGFLVDMAAPSGDMPLVGDADDGMVTRFDTAEPIKPFDDVISSVAAIYGALPGALSEGPLTEKAFWYAFIAGNPRVAQPQQINAHPYPRVYPSGGWVALGNRALHVLFDAGPLGYPAIAAHGHADALSIQAAYEGQWWLIDPGTYAYHDQPEWRHYFRSNAAHNTLAVEGADLAVQGGSFLWLHHPRVHLISVGKDSKSQWAEGSHSGWERWGLKYCRQVICHPDKAELRLLDRLECKKKVALMMYFHFHPDKALTGSGTHWRVTDAQGRYLDIEVDTRWEWEAVYGQESPPLGWYSASLGHKVPCWVLRGRWEGKGRHRVTTCMRFGRENCAGLSRRSHDAS